MAEELAVWLYGVRTAVIDRQRDRLRRFASDIITDLLDRVPDALHAAQDETEDLPPEVPDIVNSRDTFRSVQEKSCRTQ